MMWNRHTMPSCENCGKAVASSKFCPACGTPTLLGLRAQMDHTRFHSLADAITEIYATEPVRAPWQNVLRNTGTALRNTGSALRKTRTLWLALAAILIVATLLGALLGTLLPRNRHAQTQLRAQQLPSPKSPLLVAEKTPRPHTPSPSSPSPKPTRAPTATPSPSPSPTDTPTPQPTDTPTVKPKPAPSLAPVAPDIARLSPPISLENLPSIVHTEGDLTVGTPRSCGGQDVTIDFPGYPSGCTIFAIASRGPLANGQGTALVVPVSTSGAAQDVTNALLYVRSSDESPPRFIGMLGNGSGHLYVRIQNGVIVQQKGGRTKYFTIDTDDRIVEATPAPAKRSRGNQ